MDILFPSSDEIIPGLYIANAATAIDKSFMKKNQISLIVNCTPNVPNMFPNDVQYSNISIVDAPTANYAMYSALVRVLSKIRLYLMYGTNVVVHCMAGKSRSATVVAAYLIKYFKYKPREAIEFVMSKRSKAFNGGKRIVFLPALERLYTDVSKERRQRTQVN
jgi:protein-tyrosine phosphatase